MGPSFKHPAVLVALVFSLLLSAAAPAGAATATDVSIDVLSNRADLLSGGDALVAISVPGGRKATDLEVTLGSRNVTSQFANRPDGRYEAVLTGIPNGPSTLKAVFSDGSGASIRMTGHPQGGPVISGPQLQPWICQQGARDAECNQPASYTYYAQRGGRLQAIDDPANPPPDTETTTTDEGKTVPFVVRVETGYQDRDQYKIATLYDGKAAKWEPWAPQGQWNRKVVITHGGSCGTDRKAGDAPDVLNSAVLGKGYIVMSTALNNLGHNCNPVIITESEIMAKEHIVEAYGPVLRTIGTGCSGGSIAQVMAAHAYPGFYDGITTQCTFADLFTTGKQGVGGHLLLKYLNEHPDFAGDYAAFGGSPAASTDDKVFDAAFYSNITGATGCGGLDPSKRYNSMSNPNGIRCGVLDHNVNEVGRAANGFAGVPLDDVGIQFGLKGLLSGQVTPDRFVDVNAKIGGINKTTYADEPQRTEADMNALINAYRTGYMAIGNTLDQTPFLEGRGPNETAGHVTYPSLALNARLDRQFGTHASHVLWQGPTPLLGDPSFANRMVFAMDRWVAGIQGDDSKRSTGEKVRLNKPGDIVDHCETGSGQSVPGTDCPALNRFYQSNTNVAGESIRGDVLKCQLRPLDRNAYGSVKFTDAQWAQMQAAFPTGVCDYSKPGVAETGTIPWLTFANKEGGEPLGDAPRSVPVGGRRGASRSCVSRRSFVIHLRHRLHGRTVLSARVSVPGRRTRAAHRPGLATRISLKGRPGGTVKVGIVYRLRGARSARATRTYRLCAPRKRG